MKPEICSLCLEMQGKSVRTKPHEMMLPLSEPRTFGRRPSKGYVEQDYRCVKCKAMFTHSTNKNDEAWTLWQG